RDVVLDEGATADLDLDAEEDPSVLRSHGGELRLDLSEKGAVVTIDGKQRGAYAGALLLPPGRHRVHLERGGFFAEDRDVVVPSRADTRVQIRFEPTAEYRAEYVGRARAFRRWGWVGVGSGVALLGFGVGFSIWNQIKIADYNDGIANFNASAE